jgi:hypothetical protein
VVGVTVSVVMTIINDTIVAVVFHLIAAGNRAIRMAVDFNFVTAGHAAVIGLRLGLQSNSGLSLAVVVMSVAIAVTEVNYIVMAVDFCKCAISIVTGRVRVFICYGTAIHLTPKRNRR